MAKLLEVHVVWFMFVEIQLSPVYAIFMYKYDRSRFWRVWLDGAPGYKDHMSLQQNL